MGLFMLTGKYGALPKENTISNINALDNCIQKCRISSVLLMLLMPNDNTQYQVYSIN